MDSTTPQSIGIVAIAGATGRVAAGLTRSLAAHGVAVRALTRDPGKAAPIIGGATPVAIDFADPDRLGQPVNYEHRPSAEQRRVLSGAGVPQLFIDVLVGLDHIFASSAQSETTMTVAEVLGRPPRSVRDWITDKYLFR